MTVSIYQEAWHKIPQDYNLQLQLLLLWQHKTYTTLQNPTNNSVNIAFLLHICSSFVSFNCEVCTLHGQHNPSHIFALSTSVESSVIKMVVRHFTKGEKWNTSSGFTATQTLVR